MRDTTSPIRVTDRMETEPREPVSFSCQMILKMILEPSTEALGPSQANISWTVLIEKNLNTVLQSKIGNTDSSPIWSHSPKQAEAIPIPLTWVPVNLTFTPEQAVTCNPHELPPPFLNNEPSQTECRVEIDARFSYVNSELTLHNGVQRLEGEYRERAQSGHPRSVLRASAPRTEQAFAASTRKAALGSVFQGAIFVGRR